MRKNTPDPFLVEKLIGREDNKTTEKQNNKKIKDGRNKPRKQYKNITFSLSEEVIDLLETSWLSMRKSNHRVTKTAIVESALRKYLKDLECHPDSYGNVR